MEITKIEKEISVDHIHERLYAGKFSKFYLRRQIPLKYQKLENVLKLVILKSTRSTCTKF